ncbi:murein DD-endopeptidase MepM/ murein hydrolase activator NlpD [Arcanobacterium pluranimalium]|uniref:M23 family metallopeptidase n=1 Tax=Arcanobacterium pluranimalium TaxID=108028 RepID=UPI001EF8F8AE|nr:M23 family metallopeptidase [Arcanobacterium pluranimalium]MBM7825661.1 murein DD-endopeptidase MepM/ murein hydrolase activator NlpD [Arcanobacterium pluranimalium]
MITFLTPHILVLMLSFNTLSCNYGSNLASRFAQDLAQFQHSSYAPEKIRNTPPDRIKDPAVQWNDYIDSVLNPMPTTPYRCPLSQDCTVIRAFEIGEHNWEPGHRGVDLKADADPRVFAPADGVVSFVGVIDSRPVISITHESGIRTTYEPVTSELSVGTHVRRSDLIGLVIPGHCSHGICLHWGAKTDANTYINPLNLLEPYVVRLIK